MPDDLLHTAAEVIKHRHKERRNGGKLVLQSGECEANRVADLMIQSQQEESRAWVSNNVKSKSSQWLNESEVSRHSESCSIQLSHFTESLEKRLIAINLQHRQNYSLLLYQHGWQMRIKMVRVMLLWLEEIQTQMTAGPDGTQMD